MSAHWIPRYVAFKATTFWGLILLAWISYPSDHEYSIMSHTFSFLGSWNPEHNPDWWWIFTVAMVFWGVATIPLVAYSYRRFRVVSRWGAGMGAFFMLIGCVGVIVVGLVPDVRDTLYGEMRWTEVHAIAAVLVAAGFTLGILWHAGLIVKDRFGARHFDTAHGFHFRAFLWPYLLWGGMVTVAAANQIRWGILYETRKAEAATAGERIGSSWAESLHTIYAFPLWENLVIYTLFAWLVWFTLVVHGTEGDAGDYAGK